MVGDGLVVLMSEYIYATSTERGDQKNYGRVFVCSNIKLTTNRSLNVPQANDTYSGWCWTITSKMLP